ncbi:MAG: DNA alkylation repair protein [Bacteroidetes bacterium]|nr:DNA alkylation repair protein [Bacteroidota bacterium]
MNNARRDAAKIIKVLKEFSNPQNVTSMAKFGINSKNTLGISMPILRDLAKEIGKNHELALALWTTKVHEARILASLIDEAKSVTESQMEKWAKDFDSWDVCDQVCSNLFDKTTFAALKAREWSGQDREFVKRAGFVLMAALAVHDKESDDKIFISFLSIIKRESRDERNFVRKSVNWALRQIGKRNLKLNRAALRTAAEIRKMESKAAKWIASDAIRELSAEKTKARLHV